MRKPDTIEWLYLDFDGFFASVEQQLDPALRGRPVGVVPFKAETEFMIIIACSKEAKAQGIKNIMDVPAAKKICPDMVFVPQKPEMYRRAHSALCSSIESVIPIDVRKSIDELTCRLDKHDIADPHDLAHRIKTAIRRDVGECITCSIGFGANRHLAKIACKMDKPDGVTVWTPDIMPEPLFPLSFDDIPGIGGRMTVRLWKAGIVDVEKLMNTQPKEMRKIWGNVTGERLWYALHGYDIKAEPSSRGMYGHGRVLPPEMRSMADAYACSRVLAVKAARRMRRDGYYASQMHIWMNHRTPRYENKGWGTWVKIYYANDDQACLSALEMLWRAAKRAIAPRDKIVRIGLFYGGLVPANMRQLDIFHQDDTARIKWESLTRAMDGLNNRYGRSVLTLGPWSFNKYGDHLGTKISYTRIPSAEDAI